MKQKLLPFLLLLLLPLLAEAQKTITGRVVSNEDKEPLPGVTVQVKGTNTGTQTDFEGKYRLTVDDNAKTLVFRFVGLKTQEVDINNRSVIDIAMVADEKVLNEVVVTGYSVVEKREITGAITSVKGDVIQNLPMQSFDRALQGRAAGVLVQSANGAPGGAVSVRIRGVGSITAGNQPLYVVDGVQMNVRDDGGGRVSNNPLAFLNPNDIESIEVLKDAATASIYGAQASNGVVLVTTKRGKQASKTNFEFNYYRGIVEPIRILDVMNTQEFIAARIEAIQNASPTASPAAVRSTALSQLGFPTTMTDAEIAALPTYNWQKEAYKTGIINNYELAASGGTDRTTFYASLSANQQDASLINIDFSRVAGRLSLTQKVNSKLSFETGVNLSTFTQRGPYGSSSGSLAFGAPQYSAPIILPFNPIYDPEASTGFFGLPGSGRVMVGDLSQNVIANANFIKAIGLTNQMVANISANYDIMKGLRLKVFGGMDYRMLYTEFYGDPRLSDYFNIQGTLTVNNNYNKNLTTNATLNYSKTFAEKHSINALIGTEYREDIQEANGSNGQGFPTPDFSTTNAAARPVSISGFWTGFRRSGAFTNIRYDFNKKYVVNLTARYDGSSRFGANTRFGFFPSVSAAWNISEESFLKGNATLTELRLRASWGSTGNDQIGNFASRGLYGLGGIYQGVQGIGPSGLGNPDLRWERNETTNLGLDYALFDGRIRGSFEAYRRLSKDLLLSQPVPQTSGFSSITQNVGEVQNQGIEIELNTTNLNTDGGFKWETNFNISFLENKVTKLYDGLEVLPGNLGIRVGYPLFTNVGVPFAGVNPANGRPMWYNINNDITYLVLAADQRPLGHSNLSTMFGGLTNTFSYKGLELSVFFQYDYGRVAPNEQEFRLADLGGVLRNGLRYYYENRWTTPGQITDVPKPANNRTEITGRISSYQSISRFYQDASYIRLKQLTLSYNLPSAWVSKVKLNGFRVYAQAVNLLTWTKWTGFDPEFVDLGTGNQGIIPQSRNYTIGVQARF
ncbi:SusC/RagA family TonB-linked outer membrane protein [Rhodoflexus caldus]|uniref:SusC/RagA family TonB-linked outer membrane protein n=1 Tax=Rhodoflexus caldus TaxID=2891236 RepID=UPI00202A1DDA|nr:TonB-dependent receptor [Rhodoflexus caldus]